MERRPVEDEDHEHYQVLKYLDELKLRDNAAGSVKEEPKPAPVCNAQAPASLKPDVKPKMPLRYFQGRVWTVRTFDNFLDAPPPDDRPTPALDALLDFVKVFHTDPSYRDMMTPRSWLRRNNYNTRVPSTLPLRRSARISARAQKRKYPFSRDESVKMEESSTSASSTAAASAEIPTAEDVKPSCDRKEN